MELAARIGTMARRGAQLPYDAEVEWIESPSNGGLMAVIPHYISQNTRIVIDGYINASAANSRAFVGTRGRGSDTILGYYKRYYWAGAYKSDGFDKYSRHLIDFGASLYVDGSKIADAENAHATPMSNYIGIFGVHNYNTINPLYLSCPSYRLYSCKVYEGDELMIDIIPVKVNGVGMLFDRLNGGRFMEIVGTGAFVIGPEKA